VLSAEWMIGLMTGVTGPAANVISLLVLEGAGLLGVAVAWCVIGSDARKRWGERMRRIGWGNTIVSSISQILITTSAAGLVTGHGTILSYTLGYLVVGLVFAVEFAIFARRMRRRHPDEWRQFLSAGYPAHSPTTHVRRGFYWYAATVFGSLLVLYAILSVVAPSLLEGWN
jgi:hypothetical protein